MTKRVGVITNAKPVARFYADQVRRFFGASVDVYLYTFDGEMDFGEREMDLYLISTSSVETFEYVRRIIPSAERIIYAQVIVPREQAARLKRLPQGTRAYLVNLNYTMAIDTISELYRLGVTNIEFLPHYPGKVAEDSSIRLAVTPGESWYAPDFCEEIIDIGHRMLDSSTIVEIALKLDLLPLLETSQVQEYFFATEDPATSVTRFFWSSLEMRSRFELLVQMMDVAIVGVEESGQVFCFNKKAAEILGRSAQTVIGTSAAETLSGLPFAECRREQLPIPARLIKVGDADVRMQITPILRKGKYLGAFALLRSFTEEEREQNRFRRQLMRKGHRARYTFANIIGSSESMRATRDIAARIARNNAAVLISGESGTGKELFAQAIHNASSRKEAPFVAVNCAAIPHNLLESELFGYEEGSFTGARKGGKRGMFEYAHTGTLFLDEIEALPVDLQAKLLRAIQEREVMRVGGDALISVDVRLISSSNENIREKIKAGSFRKDLYYRISTLPLDIPALRQRKEDIPELARYMQEALHTSFTLSPEAMEAFLRYDWDGNVRELRNYVEYLGYLEKETILFADLPAVFHEPTEKASPDELRLAVGARKGEYLLVLRLLANMAAEGRHAGRKSLAAEASLEGVPLSEQEVRLILSRLEELGAVRVRRGRGGSVLTEKGRLWAREKA